MLRAEVSLSTQIRYSGAEGPPRLHLAVKADTGPLGFALEGALVITGLDAWRMDQLESELVRRLGGRATLCLGPKELGNLLDGYNTGPALHRIAMQYNWAAVDIAGKAGVDIETVQAAMRGASSTDVGACRRLAALIERVTCDPMPDETIRRCRAPRFSQARAAERMEVPLDTYCAWEDGTAPVPLDMRGPLRDLLGLPPGTWPGEALSLWTPIDPASTKPPMLIAWPGGPAGQDIRSARHARRWTQSELARHLDISHKTVSNWERGRSGVPKRHHALLCRLLGLDSPDLKPHNKDAA